MKDRVARFATGFGLGAVAAVALNLFPYWQTYRAYRGDGDEIIGFPFVFRRMGGMGFSYTYRSDLLLADLAIGFGVALGLGCIAVILPRFVR